MSDSEEPMTDLANKPDVFEGVDEELLEEVRRLLGATSSSEVINVALRRLVDEKRERRLRAYDNLQRMVAEGLLDLEAIERGRK
jgi:hypothetical protein